MILLGLALSGRAEELRYRVEIPDYPGAVASSDLGAVLEHPPDAGTPWRYEEAPVPDGFIAEEAIDALGVNPWHEAGYTGAGVKIAVFDVQWYNADMYADELGAYTTHDCQTQRSCDPAMDTFRPRYSFEEGSHGVACAEVIRDIAPGAELHLVRVNGQTTFENAANWAVREGIDVVSMSMSFFNSSFYDGTGPINAVVDVMRAGGVLLVDSAGNYATEHWMGDFSDADNDGYMEFPWGSAYLPVYLGQGTWSVLLSWDQFNTCGDTDLDVIAYDDDADIVGRAENTQSTSADACEPVERLTVRADSEDWYYLQIFRKSGDPSTRLSVFARDAYIYQYMGGSIADPGSHPSAFTVGAVRGVGYLANAAESFSSIGPTHGGIPKPDIAGPDGLSTEIYGSRGFYGTSAATPAVAATLTLLMEEDPTLTAFDAAEKLRISAISDRATWEGPDPTLGAGYARLPPLTSSRPCGGDAAMVLPGLVWWGYWRRRRTYR